MIITGFQKKTVHQRLQDQKVGTQNKKPKGTPKPSKNKKISFHEFRYHGEEGAARKKFKPISFHEYKQ